MPNIIRQWISKSREGNETWLNGFKTNSIYGRHRKGHPAVLSESSQVWMAFNYRECSSEIQNDKVRRDGRRMDEIDCIDYVYPNESTSNDVRRIIICARRLMSDESLSDDVNNANSIAERISNIELLKQRLKTNLFRQSYEIPVLT